MTDLIERLERRIDRKRQEDPGFWDDAEVIYSYSREQAIEDGVLVDVSETAREAGFIYPVALTSAVWVTIENIPPNLQGIQDVEGRLWDVIYMASVRVRIAPKNRSVLYFGLHMDRNERGRRLRNLRLKIVIGPGDTPEPVITIMYPQED